MIRRRRMLDPSLWEDEHFGKLSEKARLLFIACINNADDEGRLNANPLNLRAMAFRYDKISIKKMRDLVQEIVCNLKNFKVYCVDGSHYIQLDKWEKHQTQRDDRRKPSDIPPCPEYVNQMSTKCQSEGGVREVKLSKEKLS